MINNSVVRERPLQLLYCRKDTTAMKNIYTSTTSSVYYIIYKITNLVNDKIYVGCHKTNNINDDYMGSGKQLVEAQQKYGIEHFKKEILHIFDNSDDMFAKEKEIVDESFINRNDTYNLKTGGFGGWDHINTQPVSNKRKTQLKNRMRSVGKSNKGTSTVIDKDGKKFRVAKDDPRLLSGELVGHTTGYMAAYDKNGNFFYVKKDDPRLLSGELVSNNKGKYYITNGKDRKLISPNDTIPEGWYKGDNRKKYNQGKIWITDGNLSKMIYKDDDMPLGWHRGRTF